MSNNFARDLADLKDWIINSWFHEHHCSEYQTILQSVILQLWPDQKTNTIDSRAYTFLNLPALCFRSLGGLSDAILPINCAWIFLYAAFYLLDKIEDQETEHNLFSQFGEGPVTNLTTGLILNAGLILSSMKQTSMETDKIREIQTDFYQTASEVCAGQHLDLTAKEPDIETIWSIAAAKSGAFFSLGCRMGAILSMTDPIQVDAFARYGNHLGTLIQIANDYEGLFPNEYGKSDIITGKFSLPITYSFQVLPSQEKKILYALHSADQADTQAKQRALQMVIQSGALLYLFLEAEKQKSLAINVIEPLKLIPEVKDFLLSIPEKIVHGLQKS